MSEELKKVEKLTKDSTALNREILEHVKVIRRRLFWTQLISWIKLAIIAAPIILLLIWLPPKVKLIWEDYQQFRGEIETVLETTNNPLMLLQQFLGK